MNKIIATAAALAMFASAAPAFADINSSTVSISSSNTGTIVNSTSASASTGGNTAGGSTAGEGGHGGNVTASGSNNNGGAGTGDGGAGGNSGVGGEIHTGAASADSASLNALNENKTTVGGHGNLNSSSVGVASTNNGTIVDDTSAKAKTGKNNADGSTAGDGGHGGDLTGGSGSGNNGGAWTGQGGRGGDSAAGGFVVTGDSMSRSGSVNVMNTNIVRVNH